MTFSIEFGLFPKHNNFREMFLLKKRINNPLKLTGLVFVYIVKYSLADFIGRIVFRK